MSLSISDSPVAAMAAAAAPFIHDAWAAEELSRNVAQCALLEPDRTVYAVAREMIEHRVRCYGLRCSDPIGCAEAMGRAWRLANREAA